MLLLARRCAAVVVLVCLGVGCTGPTRSPGAPTSAPTPDPGAAVLREWDAARAAAWAAGDPVALGALYLPGAAAGRRDVRLLHTYLARGLRVNGLQFQRLQVRVLAQDADLLRLDVVERLLPASVRSGSVLRRLPAGQPVRRVVELRRVGDSWRVASVVTR